MPAINELLLEEVNAKEDLSLRLGDALDVKASIGLALILFLATQTAYFLDKGLPRIGMAMQLFAVICIVVAALFALLELWPRKYYLPDPESDYVAKRIEQLTTQYSPYPEIEANVTAALMKDQIQWAKDRLTDNRKKNSTKSTFLNWSFGFTAATVALNLLTLLTFIRLIF